MILMITAFVMSATCALVAIERVNSTSKHGAKYKLRSKQIAGFAAL